MIKSKDTISLLGHPLFSLVRMDTPTDDSLDFPSDACVAYILEGDDQVFSESEGIVATPHHAIVSLCGLTLGNILAQHQQGSVYTVVVHFNRKVLETVFEREKPALWEELEKPITQFVAQTAATEVVRFYFDSVVGLFDHKEVVTESILKIKLKEVILYLLQTDNSEYIRDIVKSLFSERSFSFKELVEAHIQNTHSIEQLAMATHCSVSTFRRKFRQCFNTTPAKYVLDLKLKRVAEHLLTTDASISSIGYECGFESPEHLSRVFKNKHGMSPSQYRLTFSVK